MDKKRSIGFITEIGKIKNELSIGDILESKQKRPKFEDMHTRTMFFVRNDLAEVINKIANREPRGFKTAFINYVIANGIREYEDHKSNTSKIEN